MKKPKLAIITTHPIQYYAPWFAYIAAKGKIDLCVFYTWGESAKSVKYEPDFGHPVTWDLNLLQGYRSLFCHNLAWKKGTSSFWGIITTDLRKQIDAFDPDEIIIYGWAWWAHFGFILTYWGKARLSFRGDSHLLHGPGTGLKAVLKRVFLSLLYRKINRFYSVGTANEAYYRYFGVPQSKMLRMPHAIDNQRFAQAPSMPCPCDALDIPQHHVVLLFVGKFIPKKSPVDLVKTVLRCTRNDLTLVLVGNGPQKSELVQLAAGQSNIHFVGFKNQTEIAAYYHMADVLVLPSQGLGETWGLVVNEAMACGTPVIVSDKCGCAPDLIQPDTGYVFHDWDELLHILEGLDKNELKKMGVHAQQWVTSYFSFASNYSILETAILG